MPRPKKVKVQTTAVTGNAVEIRAAQEEFLADANEALRSKIDWIIDWYKRDARNSLISRWELGNEVAEVIEDQTKRGCSRFGSKALQAVAAFSGEAKDSLRICAKMAEIYSKARIEEISELLMSDNVTPLSFSHMRAILSLDNAAKREKAIELTLEHCWTSPELSKYVCNQTGAEGSGNPRGRPVAKPKDLFGVIDQQLNFASDFEKRNTNVWRDPKFSVSGQLEKLTETEYTEDLANKLGQLAHQMRQLADEAEARAKEAEKKLEDVRKVLDLKFKTAKVITTKKSKTKSSNEDVNASDEDKGKRDKASQKTKIDEVTVA